MDNRALLALGALLQCSSLLVSLGGAVAKGNKEEGMELVRKFMDQIHIFCLLLFSTYFFTSLKQIISLLLTIFQGKF